MHRGSSNGSGAPRPIPETLPLSASRPLWVTVEIRRGGKLDTQRIELPENSSLRELVRAVGHSPEGTAVLIEGTPVPLDTAVSDGLRVVVIPTYSGG